MDQETLDDETGTAILEQLQDAASAVSIDDVMRIMQQLDSILPNTDGVKWFNLLYLMVTKAANQGLPGREWSDATWLHHLDVAFAKLYFGALAGWQTDPQSVPRAWAALFEARADQSIQRVQFALAGMNAHINHDLPIAVVQIGAELGVVPARGTAQYQDFEAVNSILTAVEPQALQYLATGIVGVIAQELGTVEHVLSMWSVATARDTAWTNAELGWQVRDLPAVQEHILLVLDRMTGFAGRGLLVPIV